MKRQKISQLASKAKSKRKPTPKRTKTSIYIDSNVFKEFREKVGRDCSKILEEFMREYNKER